MDEEAVLRYLPLAASLIAFAFAAPAAAQSFPHEMDDEIARSLPSPGAVEGAGRVVERVADAVLDVPVGGVVEAIDPTRRVDRDETLGDMAGRDDPYARERIRDSIGGLTVGMNEMMTRIAVIAPVLRRSLADLERNLGGVMRDLPGRDYDRDWDD